MTQKLSLTQQARLLKWGLDRGLLTQEEVGLSLDAEAATLSEADLAERFQLLLGDGKLKRILDAAQDLGKADTQTSGDGGASGSSSDRLRLLAEAAAMAPEDLEAFSLPGNGRYLPLAFLGDGGMGRVYKAFDQQLKRVVALKFLTRLEQGPMERFLQEGRAQAQIEHPNVCNVYSVDEFEGQPYLSMRFIAGPTLKEALPQLNLEQKARIVAQVALALHACHTLGIIHRDIKPGNIMLERREDGAWWPFLLDFGLARDLGDEGMTVPGIILGTPIYCSPEQVQGRMAEVDRRSDVYSLGATLYECLGGAPPFPSKGDLVDLIRRISTEDPVPLTRSHRNLPLDLQTIVMKALEKEPARRYDSARAFAEDLQRFLDGDPILAHSASLAYRLTKRFRKNRPLAMVALGSLVLVLAFAAFGVTMAWRGRMQSQSSLQYGREAERMEAILLRAYGLPLHDIRPERAQVQGHLDRIQASLPSLGRWSQGAAHLALGRGYLALDRLEEARRELELGSAGAPRDPDTALALGLTLTRLYQAELEGLRGKTLEDRKKELEAGLRQPALACLRRAQGAHQDGPAFVEGVLAMVEERYDDAILKARDYQRLAPWAYDGPVLEADAHRALAGRAFGAGNFALTETHLDLGAKALVQAREVARSAPLAYLAEVQRRMLAYQVRLDRGQATQEDRDWALEATRLCLQANPEDWKALGYQAAIHRRWGALLFEGGQDPSPSLNAAIEAAEAGLKVRPLDNPLWNNLGTVLRNRADWESSQGQDPTRTLERAIQALQKAMARPQFRDWLLDSIGCCYGNLGRYQLEHGQDPTQAVQDAVSALTQAAALKPWVGHATSQAGSLQDLALYQTLRGQDPLPALEAAHQAFATGLRLNAHSYQAQLGMAGLLLDRAEARQHQGRPDLEGLKQAQDHLREALALNPRLGPQVLTRMGQGHALEALALRDQPSLRGKAIQAAREELLKAAAEAGRQPALAVAMASAYFTLHQAEPKGGDAAAGLKILGPALVRRPWDGLALYLQSRLLAARGLHGEAEAAFSKACALNGNLRTAARSWS
jgi:serine/threonine-protein kinase